MDRQIIVPSEIASPVGPYSAGTVYNGLIFISGQTGQEPSSGLLVSDDFSEQAHQAIRNVLSVVAAAGGDTHTILKVNCYLRSMDNFQAFNAVYTEYFGGANYPARTCVAVADLPINAQVEVEAVAFRTGIRKN